MHETTWTYTVLSLSWFKVKGTMSSDRLRSCTTFNTGINMVDGQQSLPSAAQLEEQIQVSKLKYIYILNLDRVSSSQPTPSPTTMHQRCSGWDGEAPETSNGYGPCFWCGPRTGWQRTVWVCWDIWIELELLTLACLQKKLAGLVHEAVAAGRFMPGQGTFPIGKAPENELNLLGSGGTPEQPAPEA